MNINMQEHWSGIFKSHGIILEWETPHKIQFLEHLRKLHYELRRPELPKDFQTIEEKGKIKEYIHEGEPYYWVYAGLTRGWVQTSDIVNMINNHIYEASIYFIQKPNNKNEVGFYMFNNTRYYYRCKRNKLGELYWKCLFRDKPEAENAIELTLDLE